VTARIVGGVTVGLSDGPIRTAYDRSQIDGRQSARLVIGEGRDQVSIYVTDSPLATLDQLEAAVAELKAWALRQQQIKSLPEVA
jgi:hypothetical protein